MLLELKGLKTYFPTGQGILKAVDGINMKIHPGETVGLVGESGSGKTMTALSIMRLVPKPGMITEGEIILKGRNLLEVPEREMRRVRGKEISMVFQDPMTYLNPVMSVREQVSEAISLRLGGQDKQELREKVIEVLNTVRIPSPERVMKSYPHQLSGGMRQRIMIAIALSCKPSLLIADEPTTALDVTVQAQILNLLEEATKKFGISLLLITHNLGIVAEICDTVYVMYAGKIMESGDVFELLENPKHPYTEGILNSVLSIDEFKKELVTIPGYVPSLIDLPPGCPFYRRCPHAMRVCAEEMPPPVKVRTNDEVYCWLHC